MLLTTPSPRAPAWVPHRLLGCHLLCFLPCAQCRGSAAGFLSGSSLFPLASSPAVSTTQTLLCSELQTQEQAAEFLVPPPHILLFQSAITINRGPPSQKLASSVPSRSSSPHIPPVLSANDNNGDEDDNHSQHLLKASYVPGTTPNTSSLLPHIIFPHHYLY